MQEFINSIILVVIGVLIGVLIGYFALILELPDPASALFCLLAACLVGMGLFRLLLES